jgi:hypothetical protein
VKKDNYDSEKLDVTCIDDMQQALKPPWPFASKHGHEVLELLQKWDKVEKEGREREKLRRREEKKEETAQRREAEKQQRTRQSAGPPPPSPVYLVPTPKRVLADSSYFNVPAHLTYMVRILICESFLNLNYLHSTIRYTIPLR